VPWPLVYVYVWVTPSFIYNDVAFRCLFGFFLVNSLGDKSCSCSVVLLVVCHFCMLFLMFFLSYFFICSLLILRWHWTLSWWYFFILFYSCYSYISFTFVTFCCTSLFHNLVLFPVSLRVLFYLFIKTLDFFCCHVIISSLSWCFTYCSVWSYVSVWRGLVYHVVPSIWLEKYFSYFFFFLFFKISYQFIGSPLLYRHN